MSISAGKRRARAWRGRDPKLCDAGPLRALQNGCARFLAEGARQTLPVLSPAKVA